ncbi:hypothetical protein [Mariniblastus fucicola]|nr:hypothetical protein [Mariniblastus fucicola]
MSNVAILAREKLFQLSQLDAAARLHQQLSAMNLLGSALCDRCGCSGTGFRVDRNRHHGHDRYNACQTLRNVPATTVVGELKVFGSFVGRDSDNEG